MGLSSGPTSLSTKGARHPPRHLPHHRGRCPALPPTGELDSGPTSEHDHRPLLYPACIGEAVPGVRLEYLALTCLGERPATAASDPGREAGDPMCCRDREAGGSAKDVAVPASGLLQASPRPALAGARHALLRLHLDRGLRVVGPAGRDYELRVGWLLRPPLGGIWLPRQHLVIPRRGQVRALSRCREQAVAGSDGAPALDRGRWLWLGMRRRWRAAPLLRGIVYTSRLPSTAVSLSHRDGSPPAASPFGPHPLRRVGAFFVDIKLR
jgi:hypothetical protein